MDGVDKVDSGGQRTALFSAVASGKENGACAGFCNQIQERMIGVKYGMRVGAGRSNKHSGRRDGSGFRAFFIHLDGGILTNKAQP